jgi:hypothetical protein
MTSEEELRIKLRKIEALFEGAGTSGERQAAGAALERIKAKLIEAAKTVPAIEYTFTLPDRWSRQLFIALCRRYSLSPYRYARQRYTTVMLRVPEAFVDDVLWPHYQALNKELKAYLEQATEKIISDEIHRDTTEAQEVVQLLEIG